MTVRNDTEYMEIVMSVMASYIAYYCMLLIRKNEREQEIHTDSWNWLSYFNVTHFGRKPKFTYFANCLVKQVLLTQISKV